MYRVVLVDDEHIILDGLTRAVPWGDMNCAVEGTAGNGEEGLRLIRQLRPDILLTDIRMPNMDGLSMVAALRSEFPRLQIAVLTAFRDFEYAQTALNLGVCRYLLKPSKLDELYEAIRTMTARLDVLPPLAEDAEPEDDPATEGSIARNFIVRQAMDFMQGARDAGFNIWCSRALRNYEYQDSTFQDFRFNHAEDAYSAALQMLGPGLSDHQTGLALDFTDKMYYDASYWDFEDDYMKDTELYKWLVEHCADYGFILRYPEGKEAFYGTPCNHPAHFRYVGKEAAKYIMENNLCLEEFIMLYDESLVYLPKP
jgi:DNA-binding NarL/FixJ family response regulator